MEWQELRTQLIRLLERCRRLDALPAQRIDDALDLVRHDEGLIALENLCSNLDDALVEVPADIIDEIRRHDEWSRIPVVVLTAKDISSEDRARLEAVTTAVLIKKGQSPDALIREMRDLIQQATGPGVSA